MDIVNVLAAYARWHVRIKAFCRGDATWAQVLTEHHHVQTANRWVFEAPHLRHCPEHAEVMTWLSPAELAIATVMHDLDRGAMTRVAVHLTIGSRFYQTVGRYKIALHALHQAVEEPMTLPGTSAAGRRQTAGKRQGRVAAGVS